MKKQKMISFFLSFCLLLGMIPTAAFAEEYHQLYLWWDEGDYRTEVSHIAGDRDFFLVFTIAEDDVTTDGSYTYDCTEALGTVEWDSDREVVIWSPADHAAEGQITATKDGVTYAIDAFLEEEEHLVG